MPPDLAPATADPHALNPGSSPGRQSDGLLVGIPEHTKRTVPAKVGCRLIGLASRARRIEYGLDDRGHPRPVGQGRRGDRGQRWTRAGGGQGAGPQGRPGRDGGARAAHRGRVRAAVGREPSRPLRLHRPAAARPAPERWRPGGLGHQHRAARRAGPSTRTTPTSAGATIPGGPMGSPSWPTSTSPWSRTGASAPPSAGSAWPRPREPCRCCGRPPSHGPSAASSTPAAWCQQVTLTCRYTCPTLCGEAGGARGLDGGGVRGIGQAPADDLGKVGALQAGGQHRTGGGDILAL
jgi:hypothetical protein